MSNVARFLALVTREGSDVTYHRESGGADCPCRTPEGYRDPKWHRDNPLAPQCNENGILPGVVLSAAVKGFVQPVQAGAVRRLTTEYAQQMFGEIEMDDHLGMFPLSYGGVTMNFYDWPQSGSDFILYDTRRFNVISANKIPDPDGGLPHHWEVGLRLMKTERPGG